MTTIELVANDQLLQVTVSPKISSGEVNTVSIHVDFSDDWDGFSKSAVFFTSLNKNAIYEIVMTDGKCVVPAEVMEKLCTLFIGIRGVNSNNNEVKTTSLVKYKISEGTPTGNATEVEPTPDVYQQLLTAYGKTDNSINKEISDRKSAIAIEKAERQAEIEVERARITQLSSLTEGSTTGDAELIDIRVKADGSTATSAGNAVREQVSELKSDLVNLDNMATPIKGFIHLSVGELRVNTIIRETGLSEELSEYNEKYKTTYFIDVNEGEEYYVTCGSNWGNALICFYNEQGTCITEHNIMSEDVGTVTRLIDYRIVIPTNVKKIMMTNYIDSPALKKIGFVIDFEKVTDNLNFNAIANNSKKFMSPLYNKKITVIGDSITEHNYWAKTNWTMWIAEKTGCTIQNLGVSGSGFWYTSPYINRIPQINADTDIIGVAVSFNDLGQGKNIGNSHDTGTDTICGYANDFFTALNAAFPTKPIICYSQGAWGDIRRGIDYQGGNTLIDEMEKICAKHGIPYYFDLYNKGSILKAWIPANKELYYKCDDETSEKYGDTNTTHPNSLGHKVIANYLISKFEENAID